MSSVRLSAQALKKLLRPTQCFVVVAGVRKNAVILAELIPLHVLPGRIGASQHAPGRRGLVVRVGRVNTYLVERAMEIADRNAVVDHIGDSLADVRVTDVVPQECPDSVRRVVFEMELGDLAPSRDRVDLGRIRH